ncbi:MAG: tetratricopeptide repeat protein [Gemmataceae bacterium]|nr:tetratricopeptide repeat protein [Gemmataceae bacterium]
MRRLGRAVASAALIGLCGLCGPFGSSEGRASLHHPDEPMAVPVTSAGEPEALPFDEFSRRRAVLTNMLNPNRALVNPDNPSEKSERGRAFDRIEKAQKNAKRTPEQSAALAADLIRVGKAGEAAGVFQRRDGFLVNVTLAHAFAAQADWRQASNYLAIANDPEDSPPPKALPGVTPAQLAWQLKLNRGPLKTLFDTRRAAVGRKESPEDERPDPIFPVDWTATGPDGLISPAEKAKLPPDALAVAQQLLLWFPADPRLYWLLAEVFAARGEFAEAQKILDECAWSMTYSNRKLLMQHRESITKAARDAAAKVNTDDPAPPDVPFTLGAVWVYFGVVGVIALFALVRALTKPSPSDPRSGPGGRQAGKNERNPNDCGPVG